LADETFVDFDILAPAKRTAKIGGEVVDVTIVPAIAALKFIDFSKKYDVKALEGMSSGGFDSGMITAVLEVVELICQRSSTKITSDWLLKNVDIKVLMRFIQYVFAGVKGNPAEEVAGKSGKN
jgi:hypothetical protein